MVVGEETVDDIHRATAVVRERATRSDDRSADVVGEDAVDDIHDPGAVMCDRATGSDSRGLAVFDSYSRERDITCRGHAKDAEVAAGAVASHGDLVHHRTDDTNVGAEI